MTNQKSNADDSDLCLNMKSCLLENSVIVSVCCYVVCDGSERWINSRDVFVIFIRITTIKQTIK